MMTRFVVPWTRQCLAKSESRIHRFLFSRPEQKTKFNQYFGHPSFSTSRLQCDQLFRRMPLRIYQYARFSNLASSKKYHDNKDHYEVQVISTNCIKPAAATPKHLRTYAVSILDQVHPSIYIPFVYFYPYSHDGDLNVINTDDHILKRKLILKQSLSEALTRFYPLAGKIKDQRHIDCNDEGIFYVEAQVNNSLSDYITETNHKIKKQLLPFGSNPMELFSKAYVVMIQVTTFKCGGISIGLYASHIIIDGYSYATFMKAWAATARGFPDDVSPQFIAPSIFPSNPTLHENDPILQGFHHFLKPCNGTTKRFVFSMSSLVKLKKESGASRVLAVMGLIWKCKIKSLKALREINGIEKSTTLAMIPINMRERLSPPMPLHSFGNIIISAYTTYDNSEDVDVGMDTIIQRLKSSIGALNGDFIEAMKGDDGSLKVIDHVKESIMWLSKENVEPMTMSSICNSGIHETDFGWGKPIWITPVDITAYDLNLQPVNIAILMDTRSRGIEAFVTLIDEEMAIFEQDEELLEMASVDPSPLA